MKYALFASALLLLMIAAMLGTTSCTQGENEPGSAMPDGSKITLVPTVAPDLSWSAGAPGTRADGKIDVALAQGGKIGIMIATVANDQPGEILGFNYFEVTASGTLIRIPYRGEQGESKDPLNITAPGEYFVAGGGEVNLTTDGITYRSAIAGEGVKVTIGADGKVTAPINIDAGGLRLNMKATDGTDYAGADVTATLKNLEQYDNKPFEVKTLTANAPSAIWGDISTSSSVQAGGQLLELLVGGKTYRVNAPKQISFLKGRLYTFNVRVGATGITVSSDDLGIADFKTEAETNAEAVAYNILAIDGKTPYLIALGNQQSNITESELMQLWMDPGFDNICPNGWKVPSEEEIKYITYCDWDEQSSLYNALIAVFGSEGYYATSSLVDSGCFVYLNLTNGTMETIAGDGRTTGLNIRCIKKIE